jgi:hypothetical protein
MDTEPVREGPGSELPGYPQFRTFTLDEDGAFHLVCLEGSGTVGGGGAEQQAHL